MDKTEIVKLLVALREAQHGLNVLKRHSATAAEVRRVYTVAAAMCFDQERELGQGLTRPHGEPAERCGGGHEREG